MTTSGKPRKRDFADMREFMKAAAEWATANMGEWPWGGPKDEDDEYYFTATFVDDGRRSSMSDWQKIDTAPRDGTQILLWAESWEMSWGVQMGYFCDANQRWETHEGVATDNDDDFDPDGEDFDEDAAETNLGPTHWLPIPAPPDRHK